MQTKFPLALRSYSAKSRSSGWLSLTGVCLALCQLVLEAASPGFLSSKTTPTAHQAWCRTFQAGSIANGCCPQRARCLGFCSSGHPPEVWFSSAGEKFEGRALCSDSQDPLTILHFLAKAQYFAFSESLFPLLHYLFLVPFLWESFQANQL